ncbi:MAG: MBL fold metallo-hydrolase [Phenylobacterium sp.]|uniref:MBL fold metallo-hydrolase n=1 Tax=Phenylobacterium sp. TaxID=1871053 RepID=UPI001B60F123|nr:MBL fold metallo-hydrolase [Phenylobacterium sp.]MBP7816187.1 MBL fold metallo-hydrolase [Phenylobacterium sp.]
MTGVKLTVHRSTDQIGGNCIEVAVDNGARVILDVGRPLDAPNGATGLLPRTLDLTAPLDGVLISHPHQDHYGLLEETPADWPVYCGEATTKLIRLTSGIFGKPIERDFRPWISGQPSQVGPFTVTPYLTDHSAFDAHMLLIGIGGKRILYSGDFRTHGRKSKLVERMMANPPPAIDVLLMEGTNLGSDKPSMSESDLEGDFEALFRETKGRVFVAWSAQNIDRTVTLYRACLKTGRTLVVDLYTAEVLEALAAFGKLPQPDWPAMKIVVTGAFARMYRRKGDEAFVKRMVPHGMSAKKLAATPEKWVIMVRPSLVRDYEPAGVAPNADDAWSWSMWRGYLKNDDGARLQEWFERGGARAAHIHTSGHASPTNLRAFAKSMDPTWLVPIHGVAWDSETDGFPPIRRLADGEPLLL